MKDLVSIIMPTYNAYEYLNDAIQSILKQSYTHWELIIVDDCSTDDTLKLIDSYSDTRIRVFKNNKNSGPAYSRNVGLENASGKYVTFLDSDDFISPDKLKEQLNFMLANDLDMSHGNYYFCDLSGNNIKKIITDEYIDYSCLLKGNQFKIMTVLIKRERIKDLRFPLIKHEDYAFYLDCLKRIKYSLSQTERIDSFVRIGKVSVSSNKIKSAIWTWNIYRKYEKLGLLKSIFYFIHYAYNGFIKHKK
ncbi:glycosyltransferase involved in cell wall biosynthesis [Cricetibacter osteomyelitidis]|uniref:Glycosyltransferase involved in cell wall biosynthesis n=1 Tax=Cricetibacter osteomyelitidis TaxID=1521931 RepID=A0A4V2T201_9PAST|nr:glycosyltransferase family 2 protein [Cricetibacter osteomyelitidis]TCP95523.1 glycosyltransferase involved in cell wall biosynthesis [Cricetibacter osteomyelitidis]